MFVAAFLTQLPGRIAGGAPVAAPAPRAAVAIALSPSKIPAEFRKVSRRLYFISLILIDTARFGDGSAPIVDAAALPFFAGCTKINNRCHDFTVCNDDWGSCTGCWRVLISS